MWNWLKNKPAKGIGIIVLAWIAIVLIAEIFSFVLFNPLVLFIVLILLYFGAKSLNEKKGQGSIARGIVSLTGGVAKKRRNKLKK